MALITKNRLKRYLNINLDDVNNDAFFDDISAAVSAEIVNSCNQSLELGNITEMVSGNGKDVLILDHKPVNSLLTIESRDEIDDDWTTETITNYKLFNIKSNIYKIYCEDGFDDGESNYRITMSAGYTVIPDPIQKVATEYSAIIYKESNLGDKRLGMSQSNESFKDFTKNITYKDLSDKWIKMLKPYRIIPM
jgi:hypothetical protein